MNPHQITKDFEQKLCEYTGAKYAVAVNSCTMALFLSLKYRAIFEYTRKPPHVWIPKFTYNSVPMVAIQAGYKVNFSEEKWSGQYILSGAGTIDSARRFTSGMYVKDYFQCLSFHSSKILGDSQGGAILHDNEDADTWFRRARFDGRTENVAPKDDKFIMGYHCYLSPDVAARLLWKLSSLSRHNEDLPNSDYADLSTQDVFK